MHNTLYWECRFAGWPLGRAEAASAGAVQDEKNIKRQDRTGQDRTGQDRTREEKRREDKRRENKTARDSTQQHKTT